MTKVTITVQASADHPGVLDVRDAMQQVLDFFELLGSEGPDEPLRWNLVFASTNSPFKATAEAVALQPDVNVTPVARARIAEATGFLNAAVGGRRPAAAIGKKRRDAARRLLNRNLRGVGKSTLDFSSQPNEPLIVTPKLAQAALTTLDEEEKFSFEFLPADRSRTEVGSLEGELVEIGTDYNQPALHIRERRSGRVVKCRIDQSVQDEIAAAANFRDVWEHRRVVVRGRIAYDAQGDIVRVHARTVTRIIPRQMTIGEIADEDFTGGVRPAEYLERLREG